MQVPRFLIYAVVAVILAAFILCAAGFGDCIDACTK